MRLNPIAILLLASCAHEGGPGIVRFENQPIVWRVDDRVPFEKKPEERKFIRRYLMFETAVVDPVDRALAFEAPVPALNVNALDEVPDSSWFDNRLMRGLTPEEIRAGPIADSADNLRPWTIVSTKSGGKSLGFVLKDSRGGEHLLKFDDPDFPELKSAAGAVVQRLFWALGYQVPIDDVVVFDESDLIVAHDAVEKFKSNERPLTRERFEQLLSTVKRKGEPFRGLVSRMLPGEPLGGYSMEGMRDDDLNDRVPHEHRRDLRAHHLFFAWVDHTDWKEDNRLDMWVEENGRGHIEHYILDFDKALGVMAMVSPRQADGYEYAIDPGYSFLSLVSFGLWTRPWERIQMRVEDARRGVGRFESVVFDPALWRPRLPEAAFTERDRFDDFWAAKRLMMLTPEQIRAAVQAGKYTDPVAEYYVYQTLLARREKLARYAFSRVTPPDRFSIEESAAGFELCFDDLWLTGGFADEAQTTYRFEQYDFHGRHLDTARAPAAPGSPTVCTGTLLPGVDEDRYTIISIDVYRSGEAFEPVEVHLAKAREGQMRIIGLVRRPQ